MQFFEYNISDAIMKGQQDPKVTASPLHYIDIKFPKLEMGMFDSMELFFVNGSLSTVSFFSKKYAPNKQLMDLIAYCSKIWGNDLNGKSLPCEDDVEDIKSGKFTRNWKSLNIHQTHRKDVPMLCTEMVFHIVNAGIIDFVKSLGLKDGCDFETLQQIEPEIHDLTKSLPESKIEKVILAPASMSNISIAILIIVGLMYPLGTLAAIIYGIKRYTSRKMRQIIILKTGEKLKMDVPADDIHLQKYKNQGSIIIGMAVGYMALIVYFLQISK